MITLSMAIEDKTLWNEVHLCLHGESIHIDSEQQQVGDLGAFTSSLERSAPDTYAAILGADRRSARRFAGHGNAIAMPYDHVILPLASRRDKVTEVRWGMADFTRRFGRATNSCSTSMWRRQGSRAAVPPPAS